MVHVATRRRIAKEVLEQELGFNETRAYVSSITVSKQKFQDVSAIKPYVLAHYSKDK